MRKSKLPALLLCLVLLQGMYSCVNSKKMDKYIASEYNNELPPLKKKSDVAVATSIPVRDSVISVSSYKMEQLLPLLFYWQIKERFTINLNPEIPVHNFSNAINGSIGRPLIQKLNGRQLVLNIEQAPAQFALAGHSYLVWFIYGFAWDKVWIEPQPIDIIISYTLQSADGTTKTGKITVKNPVIEKQNLRYFQSWRSAISEHLNNYNTGANTIAKSFVTQMMEEIP